MSNEIDKELLLDHEYDGIQEYDNPLPNWWLFTFYIMIVFTPIYIYHYHYGSGLSLTEELNADMAKIQAVAVKKEAKLQAVSNEELLALMGDNAALAVGKTMYAKNCVACHGAVGEGGIGPNLTDKYWIHGGSLKDIMVVIQNGALDKGMPEWKNILKPNELQAVTAYVGTLMGTDPDKAKAPQGELVE
ncbi:MAG: c-type cytochrome [Bdellovibrionaceae bacterium]|jgi:cytochrome c oxidase cbb3-type subunit III|nr:c-type cytochrome [Pseudobdellovibrionaceae bacterium]